MSKVVKLAVEQVTNAGEEDISSSLPYVVTVTLEGACDILFHRWNNEAVETKAKAAKGSDTKKRDNIESYVYRNEAGEISIPGEYVRMAIIYASKFRQDPRSPRKSAMDLFKAAIVSLTPLASLGVTKWEFEDRRRVIIQRSAITRVRPAMKAGWQATFDLQVNIPEYIDKNILRETIEVAGRLIGIGDFRPSYGRFGIVSFG